MTLARPSSGCGSWFQRLIQMKYQMKLPAVPIPAKPPSPALLVTDPLVTKPLGKVLIRTHGCKLNQADSDAIARQFLEAGYRLVNSVSEADVFVLNTCTVTGASRIPSSLSDR